MDGRLSDRGHAETTTAGRQLRWLTLLQRRPPSGLSSVARLRWPTRLALALLLAGAWGATVGWWTPRGPLTSAEALTSIVVCVAVGAGAGLLMQSRWAMVLVPAVFAIVVELVRSGVDGPTVDALHASTYGVIALAAGRGFHALVSLLPLALGAAVGAGAARALTGATAVTTPAGRVGRWLGRGVAVCTGIALLGLVVLIARPPQTATITTADGEELTGSVAEITRVEIGGRDLTLMIRGHDVSNPVLLFLAGGPGGSELGAMRNHLPELEEHVTVVTWDQRGAGSSYPQLDPTSTVTVDGYVRDTIEVTEYLRERFGQERVYLLGQSWGSILGVLAVQERPELYAAYIGTGQMVSPRETDTIIYEDTRAWARDAGRSDLTATLDEIGPPPYDDVWDYEPALSYEHEVYPYDRTGNSEGEGGFSENLVVEEYALIDQVHALGAFLDTFQALYPQLQDVDLRVTGTDLDVPVYVVQGAHEARGRAEPFAGWFDALDAPRTELAVLDASGHRPPFEQPDEFVDYLTTVVLDDTDR